MINKARPPAIAASANSTAENFNEIERLLKTGALQTAILNSPNFMSIATDEKGIIHVFNVGAERMLGYAATDILNKMTPGDISDPQELIKRAEMLSHEFGLTLRPGFETLIFKAARMMEDVYELTYIRRDGSRLPVVLSVSALHNDDNVIIGYLLMGTDNSARKRAEEAQQYLREIQEATNRQLSQTNVKLQRKEEKLRVTLHSIGDGVISTDVDGCITIMNEVAARLTGWSPELAIGKSVSEVFHVLHHESREALMVPVMAILAERREPDLPKHTIMVARHGSECITANSCAAIRDRDGNITGAVLVFRDISQEYVAQQALCESVALTQTILNTVEDSIITFRARGSLLETFNPAVEKMFGYDTRELIGKSFSTLIPELDQEQGIDSLEYYTADENARATIRRREVSGRRRDGSIFPVEMAISEMWLDGELYFTGILRDVTLRKQAENERARLDQALLQQNIELESARQLAEKANLAKSIFLSRMSHELRTPLNAILGFAQLLEAGTPPPTSTQLNRVNQIIKGGWYLLELINEILDLAIIESGKLSLSREAVSLSDVMLECQSLIEPEAQKHDIHLRFIPFDSDWFAYVDRTRLKQILINLLSNAVKYNRKDGTVEVKCTSTSERLHISIKDTGIGLSADDLLQLFQPFNRLGQENGSEEGTGIGLVVTKQLVELMGGTIGIQSTVGVGSEFWVELIRHKPPQPMANHFIPAQTGALSTKNLAQYTLLYVEDNPANLMMVEQLIEGFPHLQMLSACNGDRGIALARAHLPDIILMDINLPGISGIEAMNILHQDKATAHIPIVALSANAMAQDIEKGLEAGFFRYLTKPIKIDKFMGALDDAFQFSQTQPHHLTQAGKI